MKNKRKTIDRKINDHIKRKMEKQMMNRDHVKNLYIRARIYLPILNRIRQMVDFNNFLKF